MSFEEDLDRAIDMLRRRRRVTYRALKRQLGVDDEYLDDIRVEIVKAQRLGRDEEGEVLVWCGPNEPDALDESPPSGRAERRQLTVMFCDLVESTKLSATLDPEDLRALMQRYQSACAAVIQQYEGHIAQYLGDGLLVYFGYPQAHEDDAQRAVRAGLGILDSIAELDAELARSGRIRLAVRVGVHTGLVVVGAIGEGARSERLALGETPNVAARLQSMAEPNWLVISEATRRLIDKTFEVEDLGVQSLKGIEDQVAAYRVHRPTEGIRDHRTADPEGTQLVGRRTQVSELTAYWRSARSGRGRVSFIVGEAGIGKSRLVDVAFSLASETGSHAISLSFTPYHSGTALHPIIEHLKQVLALQPTDSKDDKLRKLRELLGETGDPRAVPLFASLLSIPTHDDYPDFNPSPEWRRRLLQRALATWLVEQSRREPLLLVWEDLHWADPSTLELLGLVIEAAAENPMLVVGTFRTEFQPPWPLRSHVAQMTLGRLGRDDVEELVRKLSAEYALPTEVVDQVVQKTDGIPLFVEEVTKLLLEARGDPDADAGPRSFVPVPATLQDSLMARLDRLGWAKDVAQLAATIGREFSLELLSAVSQMGEDELARGLQRLTDAELVYPTGALPHAAFAFKHALIRDVAYESLLRSTRQEYHQALATALEARFADVVETQPELLAHHLTEASQRERAVTYWRRAGERAIERSAHHEAIVHLERGLDVLGGLPDSAGHRTLDASLRTTLGVPLTATRGYGAPEVFQTYDRARQVAEALFDPALLFRALYGIFRFHMLRAEYDGAIATGEKMLAIAERSEDAICVAAAHRSLGATLFYRGEAKRAITHLSAVVDSDVPDDREGAFLFDVVDSWATSRAYAAWCHWLLGRPDRARRLSDEAIDMARSLNHPFTLALVLSFAAWLHQFCGDIDRVQASAEEAVTIAEQHGFEFWVGWGNVLLGWTNSERGHPGHGLARMREGIRKWRSTGSELGNTYFLALLFEVGNAAHEPQQSARTLDDAQAFADSTDERFWQAELHRLRGDAAAARGEAEAARKHHRVAFEHARSRGERALELRAAVSLARNAGRGNQEAPSLLREVYESFDEGHDTADLQAARELLDS